MSPTVYLDPAPAIRRDQRSLPKTDRLGSQLAVGKLQHDAAHVLVGEEVLARELEVVQGATHVVKEGVATPACEEAIVASLRHLRIGAARHRCVLDDRFPTLARPCGVGALHTAHCRTLRPVLWGREPYPIGDVGDRVPGGVDL